MKLDWKNVLGAAFFVMALFGSGMAKAAEQSFAAANQNAICSCTRIGFNDPTCQAIRERTYGGGAAFAPQGHAPGIAATATPAPAPIGGPAAPQTQAQ